jgi:hypothetical protein
LTDSLVYDRQGLFEPGMNIIIEPQILKKELEVLGFSQIEIAAEGGLHFDQSVPSPKPFFKGDYYGQMGVYEVVATKD